MASKPPVPRVGTPPSRPRTPGGGHGPSRPTTANGYIDGYGGTTVASGGERVKVVVRVRPPLRADEEGGAVAVSEEGNQLLLNRPAAQVPQTEHNYDVVLPPTATQQDVYVAAVKDVVEDVLNGYNGTVMAYGQTGAGKTHTLGNIEPNAIGMIPRAVAEIFKQADDDRAHVYTVSMSYIQIYMELIQDLLKPDTDNLQIREDANGVFIAGVKEVKVNSMEHCLHYLELGEQNRTFAFTHLNAHSSRSHAVVMLTVTKRARHLSARESAEMKALERDGVTPQKVRVGKLFLVDLAGSERLKKSKSVGIRATEAISINLSLTTLGMCINARATDSPHVPFRDSKLTRLLQESLGGNAKTSLIICVADVKAHVDESLMSLQFASRAMCVKNKPRVNERIDYKALQDELLAELNSDDRNEKRREITAELFRHDYEVLQKERDQYRQIAEALTRENEEEEARRLRMLEKKEQELQVQQAALQRQQEQLEQHRQLQHQMSQTLQEVQRERDQYLKRTETLSIEREEERKRLLQLKEQEVVAQQQRAQHVQQQLQDAQRRVVALESQIRDVMDDKEALQQQNQDLRGHLKSSVAVAEQLQQQLEEQQEDSNQRLLEEREQATAALAAARQEQEEAAAKHEEHVLGVIAKYTAEMQAAQEAHASQVHSLRRQLKQGGEEHSAEVERLCAMHKQEVADVRSRMESIISSLHQQLAAAQEAHAQDLAKVQEQHQEENTALHTTIHGLQADIRGQDELIQALQEQLHHSQRQVQHLEGDLHAARHRAAQLEENLSASAREAGHLEDELQDARRQASQLQAAMLEMQAVSERLVSQAEQRFTDALAQRTRALDTLQRQVAKLRSPLASLKQQRAQLRSARAYLADQVNDLEGQVARLQAVVSTRTREAEVLANELLDSRREGEQLRRELEDLGLEADSREEDNEDLRERLAAQQVEMERVKGQLASSQQQCSGLEQQLAKFTADRASAFKHRHVLRKHHQAAAVIQRAWRTHAKKKLVSHLSQGEKKLDMAIQKVSDLQQVQQQTNLTLGHNLLQSSMTSFRDGVETIMATFMLPKKELQARLNAQQRMQNLSPGAGGFNAASPRTTPRRDSGSSAATNTPRTPPTAQRMPLSPLSSHLSRFTNPSPKLRRLSNGSLY